LLGGEASRLDPARNGHGNGTCKDASRSSSGERRFQPPATSTVKFLPHSTGATCAATSNSKLGRPGVIKGAQPNDVLFQKGRRTMHTSLKHTLRKPKIEYTPTPRLITLFNRTDTYRRNPKSMDHPTTPSNQTLLNHRSYTEVVREGMEGSGKFGHGAGNGPCGTGNAGFHGQAQGQAYTRQGYQRPYQRYGATWFHCNRGGGRRYDQRGRGFGGNFRQTEFRPSHGDQCQSNATSRDMEVNLHGQGTVHGNATQCNQYVEVHGQ
jgi:hypothetical protein